MVRWCFAIWVVFAGQVCRAESYQPDFFLNGTVDLASAFSDRGLPVVNDFRRGDNPFDNLRLTLYGDIVVHPRIEILNQVILAPSSRTSPASFLRTYVRFIVTDEASRLLTVEAGKIPTPFGGYGGRAHSDRNPLVTTPLMYHYFTSLRTNQLPADAADLLAHRGEGPSGLFTGFAGGGSSSAFNGMPLLYDACWDFGARLVGALWRVEYSLAVTQGAPADPRNNGGDNNDGKAFVGHADLVLAPGLLVGGSFGIGPYLSRSVASALPAGSEVEDFDQVIAGANAAVAFGHLSLLGEFARSVWTSPFVVDAGGELADLTTVSWYVEGTYALGPGTYIAGRVEGMRFGEIDDGAGGRATWDDDVDRVEAGVGHYLTDRTIAKVLVQYVDKKGPRGFSEAFPAAQLSISF